VSLVSIAAPGQVGLLSFSQEIGEVLLTRPDSINLYNKGCAATQARQHAEAAVFFSQALLIEPASLVARFNLGGALREAGNFAGALAAFRQCMMDHPEYPESRYNVGWGGSGRGKSVPETARAHVRALAGFYPEIDFTPLLGGDAMQS
jgi:tetratricopeptide (TPR) repeat protein